MKILALDPSSTNVGYCIAQGRDYAASGCFAPRGKADVRVRRIVLWADGMLQTYEPNIVALEEPAGDHGNRKTDRLLARVGGAIEALAVLRGLPVVRVWPSQVKATKCCKDNLRYAAAVAGKAVGKDEADAIGVWLAVLARGEQR